MNSTITTNNNIGFEYSTYIIGGLFVISEIMPFVKKTEGSGILHILVCLLKGSKCFLEKSLEVIENVDKNNIENKV